MTEPGAIMDRRRMLCAIDQTDAWDVIVIGGGATGLGAAVDAASRGYRTVLLEARDFAHGTSSRSTKLVHGGIRYLRQGEWSMVREALQERERLLHNAPHLVHPQPFVLPTFRTGSRWYYLAGLKLYDMLAGSRGFGGSRLLSRRDVRQTLPGLSGERLRGGVLYYDGQFDDARLAVNLARTFADLGGVIVNYMLVDALLKSEGRIRGVTATDEETGDRRDLRASVVINATGVFSDFVRRLDDAATPASIVASQGAHIVLDRSFLGSDAALMIPETDDGRVLFAIPWHGRLLVGTTDVLVNDIAVEPRPLEAEIEFLLKHAGRYLARKPVRTDVLSVFAGLRPLVKPPGARAEVCATGAISRDCSVTVSDAGLVTICGGKWTTYRHMGELAVDAARGVGDLADKPSATANLRIHGAMERAAADVEWNTYGSDAQLVDSLAQGDPRLLAPFVPAVPCRPVDVIWAVRHEMARRVEDVLSRRTRCLLLDARGALRIAPQVAAIMAAELGRDAAWQQREIEAFTRLTDGYIVT